MRGVYIELEGPDGCGKSTHARLLADRLASDGALVWLSAQPTADTRIGRLIRDVLAGRETLRDQKTLPLLFAADRMEYSCEIRARLDGGAIVVGDRGALSTWAYATAAARAAGDPLEEGVSLWSDALSDFALRPSLVVVLTLPLDECTRRLDARKLARATTEADGIRPHVARCYEDEAIGTRLGRVVEYVSAAGSVAEVQERIHALVAARIAAARAA